MKRPCTCEKCHLCFLYNNDPRYRKVWGGSPLPPSPLPERHYVLHLARRTDRLENINTQFARIGVTPRVFESVDGMAVKKEIPRSWKGGPGGWGCRSGHLGILSECLRDGIGSVAVYEDDVEFVDGYTDKLSRFLAAVPEWDALLLGGQPMSTLVKVNELVLRPGSPKGVHRTHCYWVRGSYIKTLHDLFAAAETHIDFVWGDVQHKHKIYLPTHFLAGQCPGRSDISARDYGSRIWHPTRVQQAAPPKPCVGCRKKTLHERQVEIAKKIGFI